MDFSSLPHFFSMVAQMSLGFLPAENVADLKGLTNIEYLRSGLNKIQISGIARYIPVQMKNVGRGKLNRSGSTVLLIVTMMTMTEDMAARVAALVTQVVPSAVLFRRDSIIAFGADTEDFLLKSQMFK
jgi:hypothetical protein